MPGIASNSKLSCSKTHANKMVSIKFSHDSELPLQPIYNVVRYWTYIIRSVIYIKNKK